MAPYSTRRVHVHLHLLHQFFAADDDAALHAAVAVDGFGGGVDGQIRAEFEGLLQGGGEEAVIIVSILLGIISVNDLVK